jgi:hypothetical protein
MEDIIQTPWVSFQLDKLYLHIVSRNSQHSNQEPPCDFEDNNQDIQLLDQKSLDIQKKVWDQIAKLKNLRKLGIHSKKPEVGKPLLSISGQNHGIEQLIQLKKLDRLIISPLPHIISNEHKSYLKQMKPSLKIINYRG